MKPLLKKEWPIILIILLPFIYLGYLWPHLPDKVPLHWNINGEIDRYGNKAELIIIPILLPLLIYIVFLVIPKIDPKNKLNKMGNKLQSLKALLTIITSIIALFILYSVKIQNLPNPNYSILGIGVLFVILGNYFKTIQPNYFIGIKTPWTLENETIWKETHRMAGKLWLIGGLVIIFTSLVLDNKSNLTLFLIITGIITVIPIVYSYLLFKKQKNDN